MRILDGREVQGYIKQRQLRQVRTLRQSYGIDPKLVIIQTTDDPVITSYVNLKRHYGEDILVDVEAMTIDQSKLKETIKKLNQDDSVHGIIIQLPLADPSQTDAIVDLIDPSKDVDGLGKRAEFTSATAIAIDWLLAGYNVDLGKNSIAIVGNGRLVGGPLSKLWQQNGYNVAVYDDTSEDLAGALRKAKVIVTATGVPGLIKSQMIQPSAVVVDAGTASEAGKLVGDVAADVRERDDLTITPEKGGVGPLTVAALFDHVIQAAHKRIKL